MAWVYALVGVVLIPWTFFLAVSLPTRVVDTHYRGAWVGFDILLVTAIILTAYFAFKVDSRVHCRRRPRQPCSSSTPGST
jgi:hypothetical protein